MPTAAPPARRTTRLPRLRAQVEALTLARLVCAATACFPADRTAVAEALRRSAVCIPVNVAEGCASPARADRVRRLAVAWDALRDLETRLDLAAVAGLVPAECAAELARHCRWTGRLVHALVHTPMR